MPLKASWGLLLGGALLATGCSGQRSKSRPFDELLRSVAAPGGTEPEKQELLVQLLRLQGKNPDAYLGFPGISGDYPMVPVEPWCELRVQDKSYIILPLTLLSVGIPGDYADRFVLFDECGAVLDVATVVWPSRLRNRFRVEVLKAPMAYNPVLLILDTQAKKFWGNYEPPFVVLHEEMQGGLVKDSLSWTGDLFLGGIALEKGRFVLRKPEK